MHCRQVCRPLDLQLVFLSLVSAVLFGVALVIGQIGLRHLDPLEGASVSVPVACLTCLAVAPWVVDVGDATLNGVLIFVFAGLIFPVAVTLLSLNSNRLIGPSLTGTLGNLAPLFAIGIAVLALGETPKWGQLAGVAIIVTGLVVLYAGRDSLPTGIPYWAFALPLLSALLRGLIQPLVKLGLNAWPDPLAAITIGYGVSTLVILCVVRLRRGQFAAYASPTGRVWFAGVGLSNGLSVLCLYAALARGPVALVAPLVATYPVFTLIFSRVVQRDGPLAASLVAGVVLTVAGVAVLLAA